MLSCCILLCRSETTDGQPRSGHKKLLEAFKSLYSIAQHPLLGTSHYSASRGEIRKACSSIPQATAADMLDDLDSIDCMPDIATHKLCCKVPHLVHLRLQVNLPQLHIELQPRVFLIIRHVPLGHGTEPSKSLQAGVSLCQSGC